MLSDLENLNLMLGSYSRNETGSNQDDREIEVDRPTGHSRTLTRSVTILGRNEKQVALKVLKVSLRLLG